MGRMKVGGAVAAVVIVATMGVVAVITRGGSASSAPGTVAVATSPSARDPKPTINGAPASIPPAAGRSPGTTNPTRAQAITLPAQPTAEDVQRILAGITAEIMAPPASTATTTPLTKAQVEQEVRSKLAQLGINF